MKHEADAIPEHSRPDVTQPIKVFVSYSHKDERFRERMVSQLQPLQRQGLIDTWTDRMITPGTEWCEDINANLFAAKLILLLISPDFMASEYCYDIELRQAMRNHNEGSAIVVPIIVRPTDWSDASFAKLQVLPTGGKAVTSWSNRDEAFLDIQIGIKKALKLCSVLKSFAPAANKTNEIHKCNLSKRNTIHSLPFINASPSLWPGTSKNVRKCTQFIASEIPTTIITGMDGVGKTSTALLTCHRLIDEKDIHSICWIDAGAGTNNTLEKIIVFGGIYLGISPPEEFCLEDRVSWLVQHWPGDTETALLVLDGLGDARTLEIVCNGLPNRFRILCTTSDACHYSANIIRLEGLSPKDSLRLVKTYSHRRDINTRDPDSAIALHSITTGLPLLLRVISNTLHIDTELSINGLIRKLDDNGSLTRIVRGTNNNAWTNFSYGWERLSCLARDLVIYISLLANSPLPWQIVRICKPTTTYDEDWESARLDLLNAGLLTSIGQGLYKINSALRDFILAKEDGIDNVFSSYKGCLLQSLASLASELPEYLGPQEKQRWLSFIPHWQQTLEWEMDKKYQLDKSCIALAISHYYLRSRNYAYVKEWADLSLVYNISLDSWLMANAFLAISQAEYELGHVLSSLTFCEDGLKVIDRNSISSTISIRVYSDLLNQKGIILYAMGAAESLEYLENSLSIRNEEFSDRTDLILASLNNIALFHLSTGNTRQTFFFLESALKIIEIQNLELTLPCSLYLWQMSAIGIYNTMASYHRATGSLKESRTFVSKAIVLAAELLGEKDPDYAKILQNLAIVEDELGDYELAAATFSRALSILNSCWGPLDWRTINCHEDLKACEERLKTTDPS